MANLTAHLFAKSANLSQEILQSVWNASQTLFRMQLALDVSVLQTLKERTVMSTSEPAILDAVLLDVRVQKQLIVKPVSLLPMSLMKAGANVYQNMKELTAGSIQEHANQPVLTVMAPTVMIVTLVSKTLQIVQELVPVIATGRAHDVSTTAGHVSQELRIVLLVLMTLTVSSAANTNSGHLAVAVTVSNHMKPKTAISGMWAMTSIAQITVMIVMDPTQKTVGFVAKALIETRTVYVYASHTTMELTAITTRDLVKTSSASSVNMDLKRAIRV
jgi:hypothetical protein